MNLSQEHNNFYIIELKSEGLASIFSNDHNLKFFITASNEFKNELEAVQSIDKITKKIASALDDPEEELITRERFNPNFYPTLAEEMLMETDEEGNIHDVHPNVAKLIIISVLNERSVLQARAIGLHESIQTKTIQ